MYISKTKTNPHNRRERFTDQARAQAPGARFESYETLPSPFFFVYRAKIIRAGDGNKRERSCTKQCASIHARYSPLETRATPRAALITHEPPRSFPRLIRKLLRRFPRTNLAYLKRNKPRFASFFPLQRVETRDREITRRRLRKSARTKGN